MLEGSTEMEECAQRGKQGRKIHQEWSGSQRVGKLMYSQIYVTLVSCSLTCSLIYSVNINLAYSIW